MALRFRPYPGVTIAALIATAILVGLGVWQLERLQWKLALIAEVNGHMAAPPVSLDDALRLNADEAQYRRVALAGRFDNAKEAYVFTTGADGAPVYHVLTPFLTDDGRVLLVDRGVCPEGKARSRHPHAGRRRNPAGGRLAGARCAGRLHARARSGAPHLVCPRLARASPPPTMSGWPRRS